MKTVELKFTNLDSKPKLMIIHCDKASCADIAAWYGCYFSSDRYSVKINDTIVPKDQNGELLGFERR